MKMLMKEWKLCMHPMGYIMLLCAALVLVPGYPYGVTCFYMGLAIFFICLEAREPHELQHARLPCPSPTPGVHSDSNPSSQ